jgi:two-component system sensor histidine kinase and response regulator WspE
MSPADDDRQTLLALFNEEAQTQTRVLANGLLSLERAPTDAASLEDCMRAAHSLKGAARIIDLPAGVAIAHRMEECFVAAQRGELVLQPSHIDTLLGGLDLLLRVAASDAQVLPSAEEVAAFTDALPPEPSPAPPAADSARARPDGDAEGPAAALALDHAAPDTTPRNPEPQTSTAPAPGAAGAETHRMLRVRADRLDRLLSLSAEALVASRWLEPFAQSLLRTKRFGHEALRSLEGVRDALAVRLTEAELAALDEVRRQLTDVERLLAAHVDELDRRSANVAQQLYDEAAQCRMRPFGDATETYPRIVRDFARSLGKQVLLSIEGVATPVDRDILDLLDAPIGHLLRNAVDHGIEAPTERAACGKPPIATLTLSARHSAGKLLISVADDGQGIDIEAVRRAVVIRGHADEATAARMTEHELLQFLLLPGFSLRERVTDVSGRGVGLDAVYEIVRRVQGTVHIETQPGLGTRFVLQLPLTLSLLRSLLVEIGGEPYAFSLVQVRQAANVAHDTLTPLEGREHMMWNGRPVGLVAATQLLDVPAPVRAPDPLPVVVVGDDQETYAVAVDRFLGEKTLVVQPLDPRLGKVRNIAAGALLDNGEPVLIVDIDDLLRSIDALVGGGQLARLPDTPQLAAPRTRRAQVLVVDDSLTVRELERKLLEARGYAVTVAVDGVDAWNTLRGTPFDLVVTDVDMPRMDGIELVTRIKRDPARAAVPVLIVSYKDRPEDRRRGLDAGADYYLAKSSFHDTALIDAVRDLIGDAPS